MAKLELLFLTMNVVLILFYMVLLGLATIGCEYWPSFPYCRP